jgi:hypothetical protein
MAEFLFIDYQDDNPQNRSVTKKKYRFAQKTSHRKQRLAAVGRLQSSSIVLRQRLPLPYVSSESDRAEPGRAEKDQQDGSKLGVVIAGPDTQHFKQIIPVANFGSPKTLLGHGFVDPFSTTPIPMTEFMNSYFHQCTWITLSK